MINISKKVLALLALLSAVAALPAGALLVTYSIDNRFFPYFLSIVSVGTVATFGFISVAAAIPYLAFLGFSMIATVFIFMILEVLAKASYFYENGIRGWRIFRMAMRTLRNTTSHLLLPSSISELLALFLISLFTFTTLLSAIPLVHFSNRNTRGYVFLIVYFLTNGLFSVGLVDTAMSWMEVANRRLPLLVLVLLTTLPTFRAATPLLDMLMEFVGFHSRPFEAVLVDDAAEEQIAQQAMFMSNEVKRCSVSLLGKSMWYVPQGVVVWKDIGDKTLVSFGVTNTLPLQLNPDQVLLVPKSSALPC